jgi:ribonucleotide reductase class II
MRDDLIKITLSHGRQVTSTPCHRFSVSGKWVRADEIAIGSLLDFKVGQYLNAIEPSLEYLCAPDTIGRGRQPVGCQMPEYMSPDLAYFVGAVFGNGCFSTSYRIRISHGRMDVLMRLRDIGTRLFGLSGTISQDSRGGRAEICFTNKQLSEWFKLNNLDKTVNSVDLDRFPVTIRISSRDSILAFFAGLVDTDGCIRSNGTLSIDMATEPFIRNTQQIGEAVGLVFGISHNTEGSNLQLEKSIWSLSLSKCASDPESIKKLNQFSLKAIDRPLRISHKTNGKKPFTVTNIEHNQSGYTYDITIDTDDDNEAWYWQGCLKSHNSKSLLTGASCGWHPPKAAYFVRRMTFGKNDPIALAAIEYGYNVIPSQSDKDENGNLLDDPFDPRCTEWLVEIPLRTSWADLEGADSIDISKFSALAQLDFYMGVQTHYTQHNTSATIELREDEIEPLATAIHAAIQEDKGYISAALLARFDDTETFPRLPFEPIDKDTYDRLIGEVLERRKGDDFYELLARFDRGVGTESGPAGCDSDKCLLPLVEPK